LGLIRIDDGKNFWNGSVVIRGILSTCENVIAKLGGLGMELCGFGWDKLPAPPGSADLMKAFSPYFIECIERFLE